MTDWAWDLALRAGLTAIGIVRELIGSGKIFGFQVMPSAYEPVTIFILAPGAFLVLTLLVALQNRVKRSLEKKGIETKIRKRLQRRMCFLSGKL